MSTQTTTSPSQLPDYIASAKPNPLSNRAPWFKNTAPTYAGIFLWFIFWDSIAGKALMAGGLVQLCWESYWPVCFATSSFIWSRDYWVGKRGCRSTLSERPPSGRWVVSSCRGC